MHQKSVIIKIIFGVLDKMFDRRSVLCPTFWFLAGHFATWKCPATFGFSAGHFLPVDHCRTKCPAVLGLSAGHFKTMPDMPSILDNHSRSRSTLWESDEAIDWCFTFTLWIAIINPTKHYNCILFYLTCCLKALYWVLGSSTQERSLVYICVLGHPQFHEALELPSQHVLLGVQSHFLKRAVYENFMFLICM